jgi:hypothetical protein
MGLVNRFALLQVVPSTNEALAHFLYGADV